MKQFLKTAAEDLALRMAIIWFFLFTFAALGNAIITAFYGMRWSQMERQDVVMVFILIFVNWATVMMAFFSKAISRVQKGELPIAEGDTQLIRRTDDDRIRQVTTSRTVVESQPPPKESTPGDT